MLFFLLYCVVFIVGFVCGTLFAVFEANKSIYEDRQRFEEQRIAWNNFNKERVKEQ